MCPRKPCLKPSAYSTLGTMWSLLPAENPLPIWVVDKPKRRWRLNNVFVDDRGFPDESEYYKNLLHNIDGGPILRKLKHPLPSLDEVDPKFFSAYDESQHDAQLKKYLDFSHLEPTVRNQIYALVKDYWSVFNNKGFFVPVKNYKSVIDTGDAKPIAIKKIIYGPREVPIMRTTIAALEKVSHIQQMTDGHWLFKALLAPKPHQEHVCDIDKFVWRFCINYIPQTL
jgi:hypothetical protein